MTSTSWQLKEAIYTTLTNDTTLMALIDGVFDFVPQSSTYPYVVITDIASKDLSNVSVSREEHMATIDVFTRERGSKGCLEIADRIKQLLNNAALSLSSDQLIASHFEEMDIVQQEDGFTYHVEMDFRMLTAKTS